MHEQGDDRTDQFQKMHEGIGEVSMYRYSQQTQAMVTDVTASMRKESASADSSVENGTSSTISATALQ